MMNNFEDRKVEYPDIKPLDLPQYSKFQNTKIQDDDLYSESEYGKLSRAQSVVESTSAKLLAPSNEYPKMNTIKESPKDYSLGIVKPSEVLSQPSAMIGASSQVPFLALTQAVPISVAPHINGVKIVPTKSEFEPVFTPPVIIKRVISFLI